ncbi:hypothetical protein MMC30_007104 [Trapelia coarctata]|nr:hypothetical protein [Trapelia coarctata]
MTNPTIPSKPSPQFPTHSHPRTWLLTSAASPIGVALARAVLAHGDNVILGAAAEDLQHCSWKGTGKGIVNGKFRGANGLGARGAEPPTKRAEEFENFLTDVMQQEGCEERVRVVGMDGRSIVAEAVAAFGQIDILFCCTSEAIIGTVEELAASQRTLTLVREQFETNFFGTVNIIKAVLPAMREKKTGHVMILTGITSHLGTPGLGIYCAAGWALEGFCDSLAYEIAPFNIKMTIIQPNLEIQVLTNKISSAPSVPSYTTPTHPAPLARSIIGGLLDRLAPQRPSSSPTTESPTRPPPNSFTPTNTSSNRSKPHSLSSANTIEVLYPNLPPEMKKRLIAETIHAVTAVGGHENPPARHIVGFEGVASVKEKLKTVSEELEDFVECSASVDIEEGSGMETGEG